VLARELPADIDWIHTHFLHTPASVARYAALILGLGWSFSAHAKDIWTTPRWDLQAKLAEARWGVTCTRANLDYLKSLAPEGSDIALVYHGLDFARFPAPAAKRGTQGPLLVASVGRAVEKKGYADLLDALALLRDRDWRFEHIGGGALARRLKQRATHLGIADRIAWHGTRDRAFVFDVLSRADLFVLPSRVAASGDRDGLPNVLMEAQAFALPVVATDVSGIPELVTHEETGLLVRERDPQALAAAIARLMDDPALRHRIAAAGARNVRAHFSSEPGIDALARRFRAIRPGREAA
jgi:glycosyltransferase involved in cell wall biosynthesis